MNFSSTLKKIFGLSPREEKAQSDIEENQKDSKMQPTTQQEYETTNRQRFTDTEVDVMTLPTPNPNALKFVLNIMLKNTGKATYRSAEEAQVIPLAKRLLELDKVENIHIFQNSITVTQSPNESWEEREELISKIIEQEAPFHNPDFEGPDPEAQRRKNLSPELQEIEEILDKTIRPGLQADGGDLVCVDYKDDVLLISYQGACGSCPSSTSGTLQAIKSILSQELGKEIDVYSIPEAQY